VFCAFDARISGYKLRWRKTFVRRRYRPCESGDHRLSPGDTLRTIPAFQLVGVTPKREATPSRSSAVTVAFVSAVISYIVLPFTASPLLKSFPSLIAAHPFLALGCAAFSFRYFQHPSLAAQSFKPFL
jgi:hypothetical protein